MVTSVQSTSTAPLTASKYYQAVLAMDKANIICRDSKDGALVSICFQNEDAAKKFLDLFALKFENMHSESDYGTVHIQTNNEAVESEHIIDILKKFFGDKYIEDKITYRGGGECGSKNMDYGRQF